MQEVADHVEDGAIQHDEACLERLITHRLDEMTFSQAGRTQQEHVAGLPDEAAAGQAKSCFFGTEALNDQLKSSRVFSSRKQAALTRRCSCRSERTASSSCKISSRNSA